MMRSKRDRLGTTTCFRSSVYSSTVVYVTSRRNSYPIRVCLKKTKNRHHRTASVGVRSFTSNSTCVMYLSVRSAPMDRSSALRVLSFSSCFSQKNVCAARRARVAISRSSSVSDSDESPRLFFAVSVSRTPRTLRTTRTRTPRTPPPVFVPGNHPWAARRTRTPPATGWARPSRECRAARSTARARAWRPAKTRRRRREVSGRRRRSHSHVGSEATRSAPGESRGIRAVGHTSAMHSVTLPLNATRSAA